jgi:hypothetical protein
MLHLFIPPHLILSGSYKKDIIAYNLVLQFFILLLIKFMILLGSVHLCVLNIKSHY